MYIYVYIYIYISYHTPLSSQQPCHKSVSLISSNTHLSTICKTHLNHKRNIHTIHLYHLNSHTIRDTISTATATAILQRFALLLPLIIHLYHLNSHYHKSVTLISSWEHKDCNLSSFMTHVHRRHDSYVGALFGFFNLSSFKIKSEAQRLHHTDLTVNRHTRQRLCYFTTSILLLLCHYFTTTCLLLGDIERVSQHIAQAPTSLVDSVKNTNPPPKNKYTNLGG